jgi:hypothetical protein
VQGKPMRSKLKAPPVFKRLKLTYDILLSRFAVNFNLRRYNKALRNQYVALDAVELVR